MSSSAVAVKAVRPGARQPLGRGRGGTNKKEGPMARKSSDGAKGQQLHKPGAEALEEAQAEQAGAAFEWHFGRLTRMGTYEAGGGRGVTIVWEEGGVASQHGGITDEQWDVFKLAFLSSGRVAVLSDEPGDGWMYDYRFLEAVR